MDGKRGELYLPYLPLLYCYWLQAVSEKVTVTITVTQDRRWTARRAATTAALYSLTWDFVDLEYYSFNYVDTTRTEWH